MTNESTIQPFAAGDIFAGCTVLNNPDDDHAGDGRIIQFDSDLNEKGVLWTEGTTHLIGGLRFGPDGTLWAFDSATFSVLNIDTNGKQTTIAGFPKKSFSNICFAPDGTVIIGEHLVGNEIKLPPERPLGTTLPLMPGSDVFGEGHTFRCKLDGTVVQEYATETHGGMPGFLGVNSTVLKADGKTFIYLSELGNRVFQYDLEADQQLDDLITYAPDSKNMAMCLVYQPDGQLLHIRANFKEGFFLHKLDEDGNSTEQWPMPGPGWAAMGTSIDANIALLGNFFTGAVAKFDLSKGEIVAQAETNVERSLAGIAQYPG
ncbi:MAG: hypothetical protein QGH46_00300 [Gammaproteobacteria bacterium]|jgi:hypothetical protein|nr:hypothetical protein [Gammaproteobacteria bacterium]